MSKFCLLLAVLVVSIGFCHAAPVRAASPNAETFSEETQIWSEQTNDGMELFLESSKFSSKMEDDELLVEDESPSELFEEETIFKSEGAGEEGMEMMTEESDFKSVPATPVDPKDSVKLSDEKEVRPDSADSVNGAAQAKGESAYKKTVHGGKTKFEFSTALGVVFFVVVMLIIAGVQVSICS